MCAEADSAVQEVCVLHGVWSDGVQLVRRIGYGLPRECRVAWVAVSLVLALHYVGLPMAWWRDTGLPRVGKVGKGFCVKQRSVQNCGV